MDLDGSEGASGSAPSSPEREKFMDEEYYDWEIRSDGEEDDEVFYYEEYDEDDDECFEEETDTDEEEGEEEGEEEEEDEEKKVCICVLSKRRLIWFGWIATISASDDIDDVIVSASAEKVA